MADLGQDKESMKLKSIEVTIRIRQKKAAIFNLETENANVEEIEKQIVSDEKDLDSINSNIKLNKE